MTKSFSQRTDAKAWVERTRFQIRAGELPSSEADRTMLGEALDRYLREITPDKKDSAGETNRINAWQPPPLAARFLSKRRGPDFAEYRDARKNAGLAGNTIQLELKLISAVYKTASHESKMGGCATPSRM